MEYVLDYADYIEMACEEQDAGIYSSRPSAHDVARTAWRFLDPADRPADPFAVPYRFATKAFRRWSQYLRSRHKLFGEWWHLKSCPYCRLELQLLHHPTDKLPFQAITVRLCPNCGWWDTEEELPVVQDNHGQHFLRSIHRRAVLKEFAVAGSELPIDALRKYLLTHEDAI
jgi:hypothetical protein